MSGYRRSACCLVQICSRQGRVTAWCGCGMWTLALAASPLSVVYRWSVPCVGVPTCLGANSQPYVGQDGFVNGVQFARSGKFMVAAVGQVGTLAVLLHRDQL